MIFTTAVALLLAPHGVFVNSLYVFVPWMSEVEKYI